MNRSPNYTFVLLSRRLIISKNVCITQCYCLLEFTVISYFNVVYSLKICALKRTAPGPGTSSLFTCPIEPNYKMMCTFHSFCFICLTFLTYPNII